MQNQVVTLIMEYVGTDKKHSQRTNITGFVDQDPHHQTIQGLQVVQHVNVSKSQTFKSL